MHTRKRVLVDVDEVLADLHSAFLVVVKKTLGRDMTMADFEEWDFFAPFTPDERQLLITEMEQPGFCAGLSILPGSQDAIVEIQKIADVYPVTRPFPSPTWVYERMVWLQENFGFEPINIVNTGAKYLVKGDMLIDDHPENVISWSEAHPEGVGVLWTTENTRNQTEYDHLRVSGWDEVIRKVRSL